MPILFPDELHRVDRRPVVGDDELIRAVDACPVGRDADEVECVVDPDAADRARRSSPDFRA